MDLAPVGGGAGLRHLRAGGGMEKPVQAEFVPGG